MGARNIHQYSGGGAHEKKSVSDGMIESASIGIKYELKRAKICTKRLDTSFIYLGFSNLAFDQLVGHQQA